METELLIESGGGIFRPSVLEGATWTTQRSGAPGKLEFSVYEENIPFTEGAAVRLSAGGKGLFYGYIFARETDKTGVCRIIAYDQIRYLKNKDTYVYENKTAGQLISMLAADFSLALGEIAATSHVIPSRVEDNVPLLDMIENALALETAHGGGVYVFYDDFGALTLRALADMRTDVLICEETGEDFTYGTSIDQQTYNRIKLYREQDDGAKRDVFVAQDAGNIEKWGILQYCERLEKEENGDAKAAALLALYNDKTRDLRIKGAVGDVSVRAGSLVIVRLDLGETQLQNYMLVENCAHAFEENGHFMDLRLAGI